MNENASITYDPHADSPSGDQAQVSLENARQQLMSISGVEGVGVGAGSDGGEALVVYVRDQQILSQLPAMLYGMRVIAYVTGEVKAL